MKSFKQFLNKKVETPKEIAKKDKLPVEKIQLQLKKGTEVEKEHTTKEKVAKTIAAAHVGEDPKYYDKLAKIEKPDGNTKK